MTRTKQPSHLHAHLGYWLRAVSNAVSHSFARKVEAEGVTVAEWVFLRMLYDVDRIAPSQLAELMGMTKGAISKLSERLINKGLVERHPNPEDQRAHSLSLREAGRALVPKLARMADRNDAAFFDALSATERDQLEQLLKKIVSEQQLTNVPTD